MSTIVSVNHLKKRFGKFQALSDVSFTVDKGEVVGFIGPNGAGKSTTIRILLGMLKKSNGEATIFGKDVWKDSIAIHQKVSYVPGEMALWGNLSGGEIIDLLMKLHGSGNANKRDDLIKQFDLDPRKKAKSYSKGNRQKVGLIAALAVESELYIFDEPTSGLDPLMENVFQSEVARLKAEGKAILLSSHILSEVDRLADRVVIIRQGTVVESGALKDLKHLTRPVFTIETVQAIAKLKTVAGVHDFDVVDPKNPHLATFSVDPDAVNAVLATATQLGVKKVESIPPTLEDLFMSHYKG